MFAPLDFSVENEEGIVSLFTTEFRRIFALINLLSFTQFNIFVILSVPVLVEIVYSQIRVLLTAVHYLLVELHWVPLRAHLHPARATRLRHRCNLLSNGLQRDSPATSQLLGVTVQDIMCAIDFRAISQRCHSNVAVAECKRALITSSVTTSTRL